MARKWLPWALCGLALAEVAVCAAFDIVDRAHLHSFDAFQPIGPVIGLSFSLLGTLVVLRRPENRIGWIYLLIGVVQPVESVAALYYEHSVIAGGAAGGRWAAWLENWASLPVFPTGLALFAFLLFPSGRLPSRRWRPLAAAAIALSAVLLVLTLLDPSPIDVAISFPKAANVTGIALGARLSRLSGFAYLIGIGMIATAIGGLVVRGRRAATQEERQQVKLVAYAASVTIAAVGIASIVNFAGVALNSSLWEIPIVFGFGVAVPAAFGFAILKYGLYEIDRVISRTLSYALLTGLLVGVFVGFVLLTTHVLPFSSPVGVAASTLAAAGLFAPLRSRLQRLVDRRFNRAHYDAEATVAAFGARLRDAVDPETVLTELAAAAGGSLQPAHVSVWVKTA
jgi:hypothetical protein